MSWENLDQTWHYVEKWAAAEFQAIVFQEKDNWEAVRTAYGKTAGRDSSSVMAPLREQWKTETAGRSLRLHQDGGHDTTWIHWRLDAMTKEDKTGADFFRNRVETWLATLKKNDAAFKQQWRSLALLTDDLDAEHRLVQQYPHFCRVALWDGLPGAKPTNPTTLTRRRALAKINAEAFLAEILPVWKQHLHRIVPDPSAAQKSDYAWHAAWAAAVDELNPSQFHTLIEKWRAKHKRRRNLWCDLKTLGLSV